MKKILTFALLPALLLLFVLSSTVTVNAQFNPFEDVCSDVGGTESVNNTSVCSQDGSNPVSGQDGVLASAIRILSYLVGVVSVIIVIYGGLRYVTSNGDPNAVSSAKNTILYALIGVVVAVFSQAIVIFVIEKV